jgi:hypothetical protein
MKKMKTNPIAHATKEELKKSYLTAIKILKDDILKLKQKQVALERHLLKVEKIIKNL